MFSDAKAPRSCTIDFANQHVHEVVQRSASVFIDSATNRDGMPGGAIQWTQSTGFITRSEVLRGVSRFRDQHRAMTKRPQEALPVVVPNIHTDTDGTNLSKVTRDQVAGCPMSKDAGCVQIGELMSSRDSDPFAIVDIEEEMWHAVFIRSRCEAPPLVQPQDLYTAHQAIGSARTAQIIGYDG